MGNSMEIKQRKKAKQVLFYILCIALSIVFIFPLVYMVVSSFKTDDQIVKDMSSIAAFIPYGELSVQNYQDVFEKLNFFKYFTNSMAISLCSVAIGTIINAMMGYVLGMLQFKGKKLLFAAILAFMIVPNESIIINRFLVVNNLNMVNTLFGLMVPWLAMPMYIYLFYNHFRRMPYELVDAAVVDGESYIGIFWKIMLPLSKPICATVAIMIYIHAWGDLLWPTMVTRDDSLRTLPQALRSLFQSDQTLWGQVFAFGTLATVPVFLLFLTFQKQFVESLASTGIKG